MCIVNVIRRLFANSDLQTARSRNMELETSLQLLRLQIDDDAEIIRELKCDLARVKTQQEQMVSNTVNHHIENLMNEVASPVAQLLSQVHLLEEEKKPIQAKDVLLVSKRLIKALRSAGLEVRGEIGQIAPADSSLHQLAASNEVLQERDEVVIRMPAIAYRNKILRRAVVVPSTPGAPN